MGRWDRELIEQLPKSVKVSASAGAGFDWVDTDILAKSGEFSLLFIFLLLSLLLLLCISTGVLSVGAYARASARLLFHFSSPSSYPGSPRGV